MTITNGVVEYERVTRPADFESKRAKVSLSFAIEDGSDPAAVVAKVMGMAVGQVHVTVGLAPREVPPAVVEAKIEAAKQEKAKRTAKTPPAEVASLEIKHTENTVVEVVDLDPTAIVEPVAAEPAADDGPVEYSDHDLKSAVHLAIEKKVGNEEVVKLIREFTGVPGKRIPDIPKEKRADFIARLKAMYTE